MKNNYFSTIFIQLLITTSIFAQPSIEWQQIYGGSDYEKLTKIIQTSDGGFIVCGYTHSDDGDVNMSNGNLDIWVIKMNNLGTMEWEKTYGGTSNEHANCIRQTSDGGYILIGNSNSSDGDLSSNFGGDDLWIIKLSNTGEIEWQKNYGGTGQDIGYSIELTSDGGYIVGAYSNSIDGDLSINNGQYDFWILKLTNLGAIEWQKSLGGSLNELFTQIQTTTEGGYIVSGTSSSNDGDLSNNHGLRDFWVVKLSAVGAIEWQKSFGGSNHDNGNAICIASDQGYILTGSSSSSDGDISENSGGVDMWILKLSNNGDIEWEKSMGGSFDEFGYSVQQTIDQGFVIAGYKGNGGFEAFGDCFVVKLSNTGEFVWEKIFGSDNFDSAESIQLTTNGGFIIGGSTEPIFNNSDFYITKLSVDPDYINTVYTKTQINIFPNPANENILISIPDMDQLNNFQILNPLGIKVLEGNILNKEINIKALPKGTYWLQLLDQKNKLLGIKKFIKM